MSRIVGRERLLHNVAKEVFRKQIWRVSYFCGIEVLTYCIMDNHFHLLIRVPEKQEVSDQDLVMRFVRLYGREELSIDALTRMLERNDAEAEQWRELILGRMGDVSMFMKMLKQRFSIRYNRSYERVGTLWAERFKSVLVEDSRFALVTVAAYIDLNPIRAGSCRDPGEYRFCGYGEAMGGSEQARRGFCGSMRTANWQQALEEYRLALFGKGAMPKTGGQPYLDHKAVKHAIDTNGKLALAELLRCRVRYFTDGVILGSKDFVEYHFQRVRHQLGSRRKTGARPMKGCDWRGLTVLRDLQKEVITPPGGE